MGKKFLLADDLPQITTALTRLLKRKGHEVVAVATNGQEAFDLVAGGLEFDILITDQNMPLMTGSQLVSKLLAAGLAKAEQICILTSRPADVPPDLGVRVFDKVDPMRMLATLDP